MTGKIWKGLTLLALVTAACGYDNSGYGGGPDPVDVGTVTSATGNITAALALFRTSLGGDSANRDPGEQPSGRREINWDGVSGVRLNVDTFPIDGFRGRGQLFSTLGTGLRVSDNNLTDVEAGLGLQFAAFSPTKIFVPIGSPVIDVRYVVAGSDIAAQVNGFGVVFSDVDRAGSTSLEFFDAAGTSLRKAFAPIRSDAAGHSFVGVVFQSAIVARVRIQVGDAAVAAGALDFSAGGANDLVATDDFIAGEPHKQ